MAGDSVATSSDDCPVDSPEESCLTMVDILEEQEALQEDADAVLGAADDEHCTYSLGYLPRQALYACLTCSPVGGAGGQAGMCLACSLHCHASHNIIELYTKRNFKCDCGNSKFILTPCKLQPGKESENSENCYSQNFDGVYCTCHRPYPDPEQPDEDEMIQCCACEDWYHSQHLGAEIVPGGHDYAEMVCSACVERLSFLAGYTALDVRRQTSKSSPCSDDTKEATPQTPEDPVCSEKASTGDEASAVQSHEKCRAVDHATTDSHSGPLFLPEHWRTKLCDCAVCLKEYSRLKVSFLRSLEDTISHYEQQARLRVRGTARQRSVEQELDALNSVDRVTRTEMVAEYNTLSTELREYLRKFADSGKVVRDEDIKEFFSNLQARKKQRTSDGVPPSTCKW
ncbi:Zinc finger FYVE/PHD-type [Trinorchestia longiramus]|nr:Zinc finger FYVE/PHD-type [Trinorchestia longiramus]